MDFETFETEFLSQLKERSKKCLSLIEKNKVLVETNLGENGDSKTVNQFVNSINIIILETKNFKYRLIEKLFKLPCMKRVNEVFRKSDILLQACKNNKVKTIKWLMTMDVNLYNQDDNGMTALMYAVQRNDQLFVVKKYLAGSSNSPEKSVYLNLKDKNGENVLFHAVNNFEAFKYLVNEPTIDINSTEYNSNETVLIRYGRIGYEKNVSLLLEKQNIDLNIVDNNGWPAAFYFAENGFDAALINLNKRYYDFTYVNQHPTLPQYEEAINNTASNNTMNHISRNVPETIISVLMNKLYKSEGYGRLACKLKNYYNIFILLIHIGYDFNTIVDEEGNTALMASLIANDLATALYIIYNDVIKNKFKLDLSIKNVYGDDVVSLCLKRRFNRPLIKLLEKNPTFQLDNFEDIYHNDVIMLLSMTDYDSLLESILIKNEMMEDPIKKLTDGKKNIIYNSGNDDFHKYIVVNKKVNDGQDIVIEQRVNIKDDAVINKVNEIKNNVNDKGENALIIAIRCMSHSCAIVLLENGVNNINHQDNLGNTALHYAVDTNDKESLDILLHYRADKTIKNNEGLNALDYAKKVKNILLKDKTKSSLDISKINQIIELLSNERYYPSVFKRSKYAPWIHRDEKTYLNPNYENSFVIIDGTKYFGLSERIYKNVYGVIPYDYYPYPYYDFANNGLGYDYHVDKRIMTSLIY